MKIKPVGNWLLLKERKEVEAQFKGRIELPDIPKSLMTLTAAEVIGAGPEAGDYAPGEVLLYRADSPALQKFLDRGEEFILLPSAHIVAKAVLDVAEA